MRNWLIILLCGIAVSFAACKSNGKIMVMWYIENAPDSVSLTRDTITPIQKAYDWELYELGDRTAWENPNLAYSHMVTVKSDDIEAVKKDAKQAARMAHLAVGGDSYKLNGWAKCIQYVTVQQEGYMPIIVFSHDYSK